MSTLLKDWSLKRAAMSSLEKQFAAMSAEAILERVLLSGYAANEFRAALNANMQAVLKLGAPPDLIFDALDDALKTLREQEFGD